MKKRLLVLGIITFVFLFVGSTKGFSQQNTFQSLPSSSKKASISGESVKYRGAERIQRNRKTYIENDRKKKKIKTKIRILHSDSCPSYAAYTSKTRERREKMLRRKKSGA